MAAKTFLRQLATLKRHTTSPKIKTSNIFAQTPMETSYFLTKLPLSKMRNGHVGKHFVFARSLSLAQIATPFSFKVLRLGGSIF